MFFMIPFMLSIIFDPNLSHNPDEDPLLNALEGDKFDQDILFW